MRSSRRPWMSITGGVRSDARSGGANGEGGALGGARGAFAAAAATGTRAVKVCPGETS